MEPKTIDAGEFRTAQRNSWNKAATGWDKWSKQMLEWTGHVSEQLVELAEVQSGSRVLAAAPGRGEPALTAAPKVGPGGTPVAPDISPEMLAHARERAAAAGV